MGFEVDGAVRSGTRLVSACRSCILASVMPCHAVCIAVPGMQGMQRPATLWVFFLFLFLYSPRVSGTACCLFPFALDFGHSIELLTAMAFGTPVGGQEYSLCCSLPF